MSLFGANVPKKKHLLINIALLTWGVYNATDAKRIQLLSKTQKSDCKSIQYVKSYRLCGETYHKTLERLALKETLRFHSWR
jgi:hypothetical protein